jgi:hypothetical protein
MSSTVIALTPILGIGFFLMLRFILRIRNGVSVGSFTDPHTTYWVDTTKATCTCPDWKKRRRFFSATDPRRLCKHLVDQVCEDCPEQFSKYLEMLRYQKGERRGVPLFEKVANLQTAAGYLVVGFSEPKKDISWVNIFWDAERYGYSPEIRKWAYRTPLSNEVLLPFLHYMHPQDFPAEPLPRDAITTIRRTRNEKDIPKKWGESWGVSENLISNGGWIAFGTVEGVEVRAFINPRANWQVFLIGRDDVSCNVKTADWRGPANLLHLEKAGATWLKKEFDLCHAALKAAKAKKDAAPRTKLPPEEIKKRARERMRKARQIVTTKEELRGFEIVSAMFPDTQLAYTDTQKYFVIHLEDAPRSWVCRLHFNGKKKKYVEVEPGNKVEIVDVESLATMKNSLTNKMEEL